MMPAPPCPNGCVDPCADWHDWERCPDCHAPFHFWRWTERNAHTAKKRLGERVYICACLLWTALHDRRLGQRLLQQHPNWSAVCNYYSMVHGLRLLWFLIYGSYPTGHAQLAQGLRGRHGAKANWEMDRLPEGSKRLSVVAFQSLLRQEFNAPMLADHVSLLGDMFESARILRNDSNYESLILAHQYFHGAEEADRVHVPDEMARTADVMSKASQLVLRYMTQIVGCVFRNDRPWVGLGSPYSGADLKALLWGYIRDKIRGANDRQEPSPAVLAEWLQGLPQTMNDMTETELGVHNAHELIGCIEYGVFGGKRILMMEFRGKVRELERAVGDAANGGGSPSQLFS